MGLGISETVGGAGERHPRPPRAPIKFTCTKGVAKGLLLDSRRLKAFAFTNPLRFNLTARTETLGFGGTS